MGDEGKQGKQLVLLASPLQGHMTPMLQLGSVLHAKGFSIIVAHTKLNSHDPSKHPEFEFLQLHDDFSDIDASTNLSTFLSAVNENYRLQLQNRLSQKIQEANHQKITITYDNSMYFVDEVARNLNVPSIVLRSCSASYVPAFLALPKLHEQGELPVKDSMLQKPVPDLYPLRYKDLPFNKTCTEVSTKMHAQSDRVRTPLAIIFNTMEFLESLALRELELYEIPIFAIGPLNETARCPSTSFLKEDTNCISWLDKQAPRSVIYVSFGSLATINEKELAETAWGLAESNQPFLWVVRPGSVKGSEWIEFLPKGFMDEVKGRGLVLKWAPQKQVLAHLAVGGFWSHCGWNSSLESISEGVLMICHPFSGTNT